MEEVIRHLQSLDPYLVYGILFGIAFVENIFPPSPSDMFIVFGGTLVSIGRVDFVPALLWATAGSTGGFVAMYKLGEWFGIRILEQNRLKFIPLDAIRKVEKWFGRYGYWIIIAKWFLAGTRAVVSFFAGMSGLKLPQTTVLCFLSALTWNLVLVSAGYYLGSNWERIGFFLSTYSQIVTAVVVVAILIWATRFLYQKNGKSRKEASRKKNA